MNTEKLYSIDKYRFSSDNQHSLSLNSKSKYKQNSRSLHQSNFSTSDDVSSSILNSDINPEKKIPSYIYTVADWLHRKSKTGATSDDSSSLSRNTFTDYDSHDNYNQYLKSNPDLIPYTNDLRNKKFLGISKDISVQSNFIESSPEKFNNISEESKDYPDYNKLSQEKLNESYRGITVPSDFSASSQLPSSITSEVKSDTADLTSEIACESSPNIQIAQSLNRIPILSEESEAYDTCNEEPIIDSHELPKKKWPVKLGCNHNYIKSFMVSYDPDLLWECTRNNADKSLHPEVITRRKKGWTVTYDNSNYIKSQIGPDIINRTQCTR